MALYQNKYRIQSARLKDYDYSQIGAYFITICTKNHYSYFGKIENNKVTLSDIGKTASQFWQEIPSHFPHVLLDEYIIMPNHIHGIIIIDKIQNVIQTDDLTELSNDNSIPSKKTPKLDNNNLISSAETPKLDNNNLISSVEMPKLNSNNLIPPVETPKLNSNNLIPPIETPKLDSNNLIPPIETPKLDNNNLIPPVETPKLGVSTSWKKGTIGVIINQFKRICTITIKNINPLFAWQSRFYDHIIRNEEDLRRIRQYIINNPINWTEDDYFC